MNPFIELLLSLGLITEEQAATLEVTAVDVSAEEIETGVLAEADAEALQASTAILHDVSDAVLDLDAADQTDEHISVLEGIAASLTAIGAEEDSRSEAVDARTARIAELGGRLRGDDGDETDGDEPVEVEPEASADDDDDDEGGEPEAPTDVVDSGDEGAETPAEELEPVAAAGAPRQPRIARVNARRPTRFMPAAPAAAVSDDIASWGLVASANAPGQETGAPIRNEHELADAFGQAWAAAEQFTGPSSKVRLASLGTLETSFAGDRILGRDAHLNSQMIAAAQNELRGLIASGGNPAPLENRYDIPVLGSEARPVRDGFMLRMGVPRGGINTITPPRLAQMIGGEADNTAASVHTNANDVSGNTKKYARVTAGAETSQKVDAIVKRIRYGEFQDRYLPELIASWMKLAAVAHARLAEETLIALIAAQGTNVSAGDDILSATRDILAQLDRLAIVVRSRERLGVDYPLSVLLPDWTYGLMRVDVSRQQPGGGTVNDETLALADATIDRFFALRNIRPHFSPDMQQFGEQGAGAIQGFPDTVVGHMAPAGGHIFLDGGSLNLGVYRDSALNDTNDVEMFEETFEQQHYHHQVPAYQITMDVDPSGTTSVAAAFDPSVTGS